MRLHTTKMILVLAISAASTAIAAGLTGTAATAPAPITIITHVHGVPPGGTNLPEAAQEEPAAATAAAPVAAELPVEAPPQSMPLLDDEEDQQRLIEYTRLTVDRSPRTVMQTLQQCLAPGFTEPANEVQRFRMYIILGNWDKVREQLAALPIELGSQVYTLMLRQLCRVQPQQPQPQPKQPQRPEDAKALAELQQQMLARGQYPWSLDDVFTLSEVAPGPLTSEQSTLLGGILAQTLVSPTSVSNCMLRLKAGTPKFGGTDPAARRAAAELLLAARITTEVRQFLPEVNAALAANNMPCVLQHLRCLKEEGMLSGAWYLVAWMLTNPAVNSSQRMQTLADTFLGSDDIRNQVTNLCASGSSQAMLLLTAITELSGRPTDPQFSRLLLDLQRASAETIIRTTAGQTNLWRAALNLLAQAWLLESERPPQKNQARDEELARQRYMQMYGRLPFNEDPNARAAQPRTSLDEQDFLDTRPDNAWLALVNPSVALKVHLSTARLLVRRENFTNALDEIADVAKLDPVMAKLAGMDLLREWGRVRNPNPGGGNEDYYNPMGRMSGTSLTRAMQVRNLVQLGDMIKRLRAMPGCAPDDEAVVNAFAAAHSQAEVFRLEDLERVMGPLASMPIGTYKQLVQTMRTRLSRQWREPQVQRMLRTNRSDKDITAEVGRGYVFTTNILANAIATYSNDWELVTMDAELWFDWAEYDYGRNVALAVYTAKRDHSFASFAQAAKLYGKALPSIGLLDHTADPYLKWFNATLGASDLGVTRQQELSLNRLAQIRDVLTNLPAPYAAEHIKLFGQDLAGSTRSIKPELKQKYLKAGLEIVGDEPSAEEARKLVDYYKELLDEIKLVLRVDGDANIGHTQDFGAMLSLDHTAIIEREAGGFGKYLMNQKSGMTPYYYGGDAAIDYRDNLEKYIAAALSKTFEIRSITFHDTKVASLPLSQPGWRTTPMAYLQLRAKDAAVDKIPGIQLDLDFFDKTGKVVLPILSAPVMVDARQASTQPRPCSNLVAMLILDDRDVKNSTFMLEIKATASGLVPPLGQLFDLKLPGFSIVKLDDRGANVKEFTALSNTVATARSERNWVLQVRADGTHGNRVTFSFPATKRDDMKVEYKQYADADIVAAKSSVTLAGMTIKASRRWLWAGSGAAVALLAIILVWRIVRGKKGVVLEDTRYHMPHHVTAFTVLALLQKMKAEHAAALAMDAQTALAADITRLEKQYFSPVVKTSADERELQDMAARWLLASQTW